SPFPVGKYTGATAASQLASLGVKYAIVGHSERRRYFSEDNTQVANKVRQCVEAGIIPIVCVDDEYVSTQAAAIDS
ncbi:triose-phosphate isomerase, partial [bacterium]|nr:triose-phosphate isomerase [bacterium]